MMVKNHQSPESEVLLLDRVNEIFCSASPFHTTKTFRSTQTGQSEYTLPTMQEQSADDANNASEYGDGGTMDDLWN